MFLIISILWPIFALLLLGFAAKQSGFLAESFWQQAEKGIYYILFPALLITRLWEADFSSVSFLDVSMSSAVALVVLSGLCFLVRPFIGLNAASFTSFYQGGIRFNTYVGLAITSFMFDDQQLALTAVLVACMVPMVNVACVWVFTMSGGQGFSIRRFGYQLLVNPLILGCVCGVLLNILSVPKVSAVMSVLVLLAQASLPLGLLAVGAGLKLTLLRPKATGTGAAVLMITILKLLIFPLLIGWITAWLEMDSALRSALVLFVALPTATSSYILSKNLGGDSQMMAHVIACQTLFAFVTLPFILLQL